ncbi:MAG: hypothetical protein ACTSWN_12735 [Promethearchaeota archaeon]
MEVNSLKKNINYISASLSLLVLAALVLGTSIQMSFAISIFWGPERHSNYEWIVDSSVWDDYLDADRLGGQKVSINVSTIEEGSSYTWIRGDVHIYRANSSLYLENNDALLGNASLSNASNFEIYTNETQNLIPPFIPLPLSDALDAFSSMFYLEVSSLLEENFDSGKLNQDVICSIAENFTSSVEDNTLKITFKTNLTFDVYRLVNHDIQASIRFDDKGVCEHFKIWVSNATIQGGNIIPDVVFFEVYESIEENPQTIPGICLPILYISTLMGISIISLHEMKRARTFH